MKLKQTYILIAFAFLLAGCKPHWQIVQSFSTKIAIDSTTDYKADKSYIAYITPIKKEIDNSLNVVIGKSEQIMDVNRPESLLGNFTTDIMYKAGSDYKKSPVDLAITNVGGLRTQLPKGNVTLRNILEIMPFENELVILYIKGDVLEKVFEEIASVGGECVSGVRLGIKNKKLVDVQIGGKPLDLNKIYTVATNDFLAGGNDKLEHLAQYEKRENTGIKLRDMFNDAIKAKTKQNETIKSQLDGRIYEAK